MGTAAYQRGSSLIRTQIDASIALPKRTKPLNWELQRNNLQAEITRLEAGLSRARRCIASNRAQLTIERETITNLRAENETLRKDRAKWAKALLKMRRRWVFVSRIVRRFVSPEQVAEFRAEQS